MFMQEPIVKACVESVPETLPYPNLTLAHTSTGRWWMGTIMDQLSLTDVLV